MLDIGLIAPKPHIKTKEHATNHLEVLHVRLFERPALRRQFHHDEDSPW